RMLPNAGAHLLPEAAATQERRLAAVRCSARLCQKSLFRKCGLTKSMTCKAHIPQKRGFDTVWRLVSLLLSHGTRSRLQLLLQLVKDPPICTLRNELLRTRLDHPDLVEAQGMEAQRVFGIGLAPAVVGPGLEHLQAHLVARFEAPR